MYSQMVMNYSGKNESVQIDNLKVYKISDAQQEPHLGIYEKDLKIFLMEFREEENEKFNKVWKSINILGIKLNFVLWVLALSIPGMLAILGYLVELILSLK